jgi:hypothetical protein
MKFTRATGAATVLLFVGAVIPVYAQREGQGEKEEKAAPAEKQQARPAQPPARQAQPQRAPQPKAQPQPSQPRAAQPAPKQQPQERAQQPQPKAQPKAQQAQPQERAQQPPKQAAPAPQQVSRQPQPKQAPQKQVQPLARQPQAQPQRTQQQAQTWQQQKGWARNGGWQPHASFQQDRSANWSSDHRTWAQRGGYGGFYIPTATFGLYFGNAHYFRLHALPSMYLGYPRFEYGGFTFMLVDPYPANWPENWYDADDLYIDYNDGYYLYNRNYPGIGLALSIVV